MRSARTFSAASCAAPYHWRGSLAVGFRPLAHSNAESQKKAREAVEAHLLQSLPCQGFSADEFVRKMMEDMYPKFAGKPLENYDLLKRADCLAFGKEVLAGIK